MRCAILPSMGNRLKHLRERERWTQDEAAAKLGMSKSGYVKIERGDRRLAGPLIDRAAEVYGVGPADVLGWPDDETPEASSDTVDILGKAGAGPDGSVAFADADGPFDQAAAPLNATPATKALEVEGTSMRGVAEDGSLIFYDGREPPNETHVGELCICWLEDGRVLIKYPYPGREAGMWNLESTTAKTLRDVAVGYFAHVINIVPRRAARQLIRRRPDITPQDTRVGR